MTQSRRGLFLGLTLVVGGVVGFTDVISYGEKIKVFVLVPPAEDLTGVKRVAVLDFAIDRGGWAESGRKFADYAITRLLQPDRGIGEVRTGFLGMGTQEGRTLQAGAFTNVYDVVERSRLGAVMTEQRLQISEWVDQSQAVRFGRMLGVDAIVMGSLDIRSADENSVAERDVKQGNQTVRVRVNCVTRTVAVGYRGRVVHTETANVLATLEGSTSVRDQECQPDLGRLAAAQAMAEGALQDLSDALANEIAPHFELQEFELDNLSGRQFRDLEDRAKDAVKQLDVDNAYVCYSAVYEQDPYSPEVLYNLGVLNEVVGNYEAALEFYGQAMQLKSEKRYREATERTERSVAFTAVLAAMGVELSGHEFEVSQDRLAEATAMEVEVKGSRDDRIPVFAQPDQGAEVVAQVPGGLTFTVISEAGEWYCIRLLGGNEGFIHRDRVKIKD